MANEDKITITDGSTTITLQPVLLMEVEHRDDWAYRDINGYVRTKDIPTYGKITGLSLEVPLGGITRSNFTQLNTWMTAGTEVKVADFATNSTYYNASKYYFGRISSLDSGAYSEAKMTDPPYLIDIMVDRYAAS
jgi:hypothetical protein